VLHIGLWGDAYSEIKGAGTGTQLIPLHPSRMKVERIENGRLRYKYREDKGSETVYSQDQILHVRGPSDDGVHGISIVESCKDAIALARACELHGARFFGSGARPGFVLSTDGQLNAEAREQLRSQWDRRHGGVGNSHSTAVLTGGLKPYEVPLVNNTDAQFLDARAFQLAEVARLFRVPMHLLGVMNGGYGSIEHAGLDFVQHTILPWLRRFESAFMRDLIADDDRYQVEFDVRGLLRGDAASRSAYYRAMWDIGALSTNDILELENRNPVDGGDTRYRPLNMGTLGQEPSEADVLAQQQPGSGIDGQAVEGGLAAAEDAAPESEPQTETSLTTAEVSSLLTVVKQVTDGLLSIDAARAIIAAAFPVLSAARVETILQGVQAPAPEPEPVAETLTVEPEPVVEQVSERALPVEGEWVTLPDGRIGRVDHVMTEGELNLGDVAMPATPEAPVALVSVWEGEAFGEPVPVAVADVTPAEEPEAARGYKGKRKPRKRKET
jgi:HK97 family phage portal protein